jgi:hypothetical protein
MTHFIKSFIILGLIFLSCSQTSNKTSSITDDKKWIKSLVTQVLYWHVANNGLEGFELIYNQQDSSVIGMDLNKLKAEQKKLTESRLFDREFIDNYGEIVLDIDRKIKNKEISWKKGDLPPYERVDPWCKCSDEPSDNPWDKIEFIFLAIDKNNATLTWTWGNSDWSKDFNYKVRVKKTGGSWKISYLEGFDIKEFFR